MIRATRFETLGALVLVAADGATATVRSDKTLFDVDLRTGVGTPRTEPAPLVEAPPSLADRARDTWRRAVALGVPADAVPIDVPLEVDGARITVRQEPGDVPRATLARGVGAVTVPGEPLLVAGAGGSPIALRTVGGLFVLDVDRGAVVVSFAYDRHAHAAVGARDDVAVLATEHELHVVHRSGAWVRLPAPVSPRAVAVTDAFVVVAGEQRIVAIPRAALPQGGVGVPQDVGLAVAPRADAKNDDAACLVRMVAHGFVALTELRTQRHFNFKLSGPPPPGLAKGDRAYVIDGVLTREADLPPGFGAPQATELAPAAGAPPLVTVPPKLRDGLTAAAEGLALLERGIGFVATPLMRRFLAASSAEWAWPLGSFHPSLGAPDVGIPIDPSLVLVFDGEDGDYVGIYHHPLAGGAHGWVHFRHDDAPPLAWYGATFDALLLAFLAEDLRRASQHHAVLALLRAIGVGVGELDAREPSPAPEWFALANPQGETRDGEDTSVALLAEADALVTRGERERAERLYVRALHATYDGARRDAIAAKLRALYALLGWQFQSSRI